MGNIINVYHICIIRAGLVIDNKLISDFRTDMLSTFTALNNQENGGKRWMFPTLVWLDTLVGDVDTTCNERNHKRPLSSCVLPDTRCVCNIHTAIALLRGSQYSTNTMKSKERWKQLWENKTDFNWISARFSS